MSLIIEKDLPAFGQLRKEGVFELSAERAAHQDIRPLEIGILNLMPSAVVERTELQLLRLLANSSLQIRPTFIYFDEHKSKSKQAHFESYYKPLREIYQRGLDGLIITGANLEAYDFEDIFYWKELLRCFDWAATNVTSTLYCCWASHAVLYYRYRIQPRSYPKKRFGIFQHRVDHATNSPLLRNMDDEILVPHSRWRGVERADLAGYSELQVLIESSEAGPHIIAGRSGREVYVQGHPEYGHRDLVEEYFRDRDKGIAIDIPQHYFPNGDTQALPPRTWIGNGQVFYSNWLNWVYQTTNVDVQKPLMD